MKARDIMTARPLVVVPGDPIWRAAEIMKHEDIGGVPVVSDVREHRLVGLITDRDITVRCVARRHGPSCTVADHMTPAPLRTVRANATMSDVVQQMEEGQVRRVPVVDEEGNLIGIVAERDVAMKLTSQEALPLRKRIKRASPDSVAALEAMLP